METTALEIRFDVKEFRLSEVDEGLLRRKLRNLARQVEEFPVAQLRVLIQGSRSNEISVKMSLILPGRTLVARDHGQIFRPAFDRCVEFLVHELDGYKERLTRHAESSKEEEGTHHALIPSAELDASAIEQALESGDYVAFRKEMLPYEEEVRLAAGRWIQRYPEVEGAIGGGIEITDIVEETFLEAFESFRARPKNVQLGAWLQGVIDSAVKSLIHDPDKVLENVSVVRSALDTPAMKQPLP